jgi:hypothetical protein
MPSEANHLIDRDHHTHASVTLQCGNAPIINSELIQR